MASKEDYDYNWTKVFAVQTHINNDIEVGDEIHVEDRNGGSQQQVISITIMTTRSGKQYKVLLLKSLEKVAS